MGSGISYKDLSALNTLGFVSELRGRHGTGVIQGKMYKSYLELEVDKTNLDFASHIDYNDEIKFRSPKNREFFNSVMDNVYLCHVRHATVGNVSPDNSHPFQFDNVIGMHNGTLVTKEFLPFGGNEDLTDSAIFYSKVNEEGYKSVIERLSDKDAFAFVFVDIQGSKIRIVRNNKRPLFWSVDKKRKVLWYASEASFLNFIAERHGLDITYPKSFETDTVYSFIPLDITPNSEPSWETEKVFTRGEPTPLYEKTGERSYPAGSGSAYVGLDAPWEDNWHEAWDTYYSTMSPYPKEEPVEKERSSSKDKPKISLRDGVTVCTRPRKIPETRCWCCMEYMNLYEIYVGSDLGNGIGQHFNCGD